MGICVTQVPEHTLYLSRGIWWNDSYPQKWLKIIDRQSPENGAGVLSGSQKETNRSRVLQVARGGWNFFTNFWLKICSLVTEKLDSCFRSFAEACDKIPRDNFPTSQFCCDPGSTQPTRELIHPAIVSTCVRTDKKERWRAAFCSPLLWLLHWTTLGSRTNTF